MRVAQDTVHTHSTRNPVVFFRLQWVLMDQQAWWQTGASWCRGTGCWRFLRRTTPEVKGLNSACSPHSSTPPSHPWSKSSAQVRQNQEWGQKLQALTLHPGIQNPVCYLNIRGFNHKLPHQIIRCLKLLNLQTKTNVPFTVPEHKAIIEVLKRDCKWWSRGCKACCSCIIQYPGLALLVWVGHRTSCKNGWNAFSKKDYKYCCGQVLHRPIKLTNFAEVEWNLLN